MKRSRLCRYYVVTNAGRRAEDLAWITQQLEEFNKKNSSDVRFDVIEDKALVALQGPLAATALQGLAAKVDLSKLYFGQSLNADIADLKCHVARSGYTGEDGFEVGLTRVINLERGTQVNAESRVTDLCSSRAQHTLL